MSDSTPTATTASAPDVGSERDRALAKASAEIRALLPKSEEVLKHAHAVVPGGFTRARFFWPIPLYIDRADGPFIWDIDDRRYIDCILGFGAMVLGHRPPAVIEAVQAQLERGTHYGTAVEAESELAQRIVDNVPGAEQVLFLNSGTESTLAALRIARAATGRAKVAKFEGGWHGWHDYLLHSFFRYAGPEQRPHTVPNSLGITSSVQDEVLTLPFNSPAAFDLIREHAAELACVFLEGVQGSAGCLVADAEWAQQLQRVCNQAGVLLVCDEVITGFRLGPQGVAGELGIEADLTTLGKAIGGGFPVGAVTGRAALLELTQLSSAGEQVLLAGTFSANPVTMVAGKAQLDTLLGDPSLYELINSLGARMRAGVAEVLREAQVPANVEGAGSIWGVHLGGARGEIDAPRSVRESYAFGDDANDYGQVLTGYLLREGVLMEAPGHLSFVGTTHTEELVDEVIDAYRRAIARMTADGIFG